MKKLICAVISTVLTISASVNIFAYAPTSELYGFRENVNINFGENNIVNGDFYIHNQTWRPMAGGTYEDERPPLYIKSRLPRELSDIGITYIDQFAYDTTTSQLVVKSVNKDCDESFSWNDIDFFSMNRYDYYENLRFEDGAFNNCTNLKYLNIGYPNRFRAFYGDGVSYLSDDDYYKNGAPVLSSQFMPGAVKDCSSLESVFLGGMPFAGAISIYEKYTQYLEVYTDNIAPGAFVNCPNLKFVVIEDSDTLIGEDAFVNCPQLTIFCKANSAGERYARNAGIPYINFTDTLTEEEKSQFNGELYAIAHPDIAEQLGGFENLMYAYCKKYNQNGYGGIEMDMDAYAKRYSLTDKAPAEILNYYLEKGGNAKPFVKGDSDDDGVVTAEDAAQLLQNILDESYATGMHKHNSDYMDYIDVDKDGFLTAGDAAIIMQKAIDNGYKMPVEQ